MITRLLSCKDSNPVDAAKDDESHCRQSGTPQVAVDLLAAQPPGVYAKHKGAERM